MGIIIYNCPDCEQEMVRIFGYNLCNNCDVVRDQENNPVLPRVRNSSSTRNGNWIMLYQT